MTSQENSPNTNSSHSGIRRIVVAATLLIALILTVWFLVSRIELAAERNLLEIVNSELEPGSELVFGEFSLGLFPPRITLNDVNLIHKEPFEDQTPEKPLDAIRYFEVEHAELKGISLIRLLRGREWNLGSLNIEGLLLDVVPTTTDRVTDSSPLENPFPVIVSEANLQDSRFRIFPDRSSDSPVFTAQEITLGLKNLKIDDPDAPIYDYFDEFLLEIGEMRQLTDNGFYELTARDLKIDSSEKYASLQEFRSNPLLSAYEITTTLEHEEDRFDITGGPFLFKAFDVMRWLESEDIVAGSVDLQNLSIVIIRDKTYPNAPRSYRQLPHSQFAELPFSVQVDSIKWSDGYISYSEQYKEEDRKGTIEFANVNLTMLNLQNRDEDEPIRVDANTRFMDATEMKAAFSFYPGEMATHHIEAEFSEMELDKINNPLENMGGASIREGYLKSLVLDFTLDEDKATGELVMIYHDLEIRIIDEETMEERTRDRLVSFFTNTFAVRSDNTDDDPRKANVEFERDKERSIFNYWWNSIKEGLLDIAMR
ncbi:MAG: hypothetical protein JJU46_00410 [Balneolaceae bacterium]|nr:hypothetical protein [Balneolaceae bacterium]